MTDVIKYERRGAVAIITLSRPESMNAFDEALRAGVVKVFEQARGDESVRAVVFTGEGRCFSAGADMKAGIEPVDMKKTLVITNRKEAISAACAMAKPGDIILVAGKGHVPAVAQHLDKFHLRENVVKERQQVDAALRA